MTKLLVFRGQIVLPDRIEYGAIVARNGRIVEVLDADATLPEATLVDAGEGYISPGFVDLHVHGGAGGDFMDGTDESFRLALKSHARHGTTRMAITTTVARHDQILATLKLTRQFRETPEPNGARVMDSTPPAIIRLVSPDLMARAAVPTASMPEPHSRLMVAPPISCGSPASSSDMRATLRLSSPAWLAQP